MSQPTAPSPLAIRKVFLVAFFSCLSLYVLACLGCAIWQRRLIYFPPVFTPAEVDAAAKTERLQRWTNSAGQNIGMKRLCPTQPAAGRILIAYGNGSCATDSARYADVIQLGVPLDVFILEYPGYADRPGQPGEETFYRAADEAFHLLGTNTPIYLLGESLGTGVAAYLAGTCPASVAGVVLFAPYNRLEDVAQYHEPVLPVHWLLNQRFPSQDYLSHYHGPIAIFVGGQDTVVPEKFGLRLLEAYAGPKRLWQYPQADHWTVTQRTPAEWKQIFSFWRLKPGIRSELTN